MLHHCVCLVCSCMSMSMPSYCYSVVAGDQTFLGGGTAVQTQTIWKRIAVLGNDWLIKINQPLPWLATGWVGVVVRAGGVFSITSKKTDDWWSCFSVQCEQDQTLPVVTCLLLDVWCWFLGSDLLYFQLFPLVNKWRRVLFPIEKCFRPVSVTRGGLGEKLTSDSDLLQVATLCDVHAHSFGQRLSPLKRIEKKLNAIRCGMERLEE